MLIYAVLLVLSCGGVEQQNNSYRDTGLELSPEMVDSLISSPLQAPDTYVVQRGDSLSGIASKYGLTVQKIKHLNGIRGNTIFPGMELRLSRKAIQGPDNNMFLGAKENVEAPVMVRNNKGGAFQWPVSGRIVSSFNPRFKREGIEIAAGAGERVCAAGNGTVVFCGYIAGLGNTVVIQHPFNVLSVYGYLSEILIECGDRVKGGDGIGEAGTSGSSPGSRLHFRIYVNFRGPKNPLDYLKPAKN